MESPICATARHEVRNGPFAELVGHGFGLLSLPGWLATFLATDLVTGSCSESGRQGVASA